MIHEYAQAPCNCPEQFVFGAADLLAALGMLVLLAGLILGAVAGSAYLVARAFAPVSAVVVHAVLRGGSAPGRPMHR